MFDNQIAWYYQVWPWVGLGFAIVLLILLFATDVLRNDPTTSRWKEPTWLAWLITVSYLLHNVEEYGIDLTGTLYAFPASFSDFIGVTPGAIFFAAVNISLFWFAFPIASLLSRKYPIMTAGMAGLILMNTVSHTVTFITNGGAYNSGFLTSLIIFLPVALWTFYCCVSKRKLKSSALPVVILIGVIGHGVLIGSVGLYAQNMIGDSVAAAIQVLNAALMVSLWYAAGKISGGKLAVPQSLGRP